MYMVLSAAISASLLNILTNFYSKNFNLQRSLLHIYVCVCVLIIKKIITNLYQSKRFMIRSYLNISKDFIATLLMRFIKKEKK